MLTSDLLHFLRELELHNHKTWFDENRDWYDRVRKEFSDFTAALLSTMSKMDTDLQDLDPRKCIFRINRDVRFSKNKLPYKTNMAASFDRGGKKSIFAGYYLHIEPGKSFIGGGVWMPAAEETRKIRQEIDYNFEEFTKILKNKKFRATYSDLYKGKDISLVNLPRGYEKENPAAEYLKLKSWLSMRDINDTELLSKNFLKNAARDLEVLKPLIQFINKAIE